MFPDNIYIYIKILPVNEFFPVFDNSSYVFNVPEITPGTVSKGYATKRMFHGTFLSIFIFVIYLHWGSTSKTEAALHRHLVTS